MLDYSLAYLIYQFNFGVNTLVQDTDAIDLSTDYDEFNQLYTEYILAPDEDNLPQARIPVGDDAVVDMEQIVEET